MTEQYKVGNELLPYHPAASHVDPSYRDGWNHCYAALLAEVEAVRSKYNELLFAVARKYPGQTRHETALMYIQRAEQSSEMCAASALQSQGSKT